MFGRKRNYYYYPRETPRRERRSYSLLPKRKRRRGLLRLLGEFLTWCAFLLLITGGLVGGGMYLLHTRFDDAMRRHVETKFRLAYPNHATTVKAARRIEGQGIELRALAITEKSAEKSDPPLVHIDEMLLQCSAGVEDLLAGKLQAKQLVLRRVKLNLASGADGKWNVHRLLPLPRFGSEQVPIVIENSTAQIRHPGSEKPLTVGIHELRLTPQKPTPDPSAAGPARTWAVQALLESPHVDRIAVTGTYDVISGIWRAEGEVQGLKAGPELAGAIPPGYRECAAILDSMHLAVHARFEATNQNAGQSLCRFTVAGQATGRIEDKRLPIPLTDVKAKFSSDGQALDIAEFSASAGQATLQGNCRIHGFFEDAPCSLKLSAQRLHVDRKLVASLPSEWRETWGKLTPQGDVDATLELNFDGKTVRHSATVDCRNIDFAYDKFPYRLNNGHGRLEWRDGVLRFQQFQAFAHGRTIHIDGEVNQPGPNYSGFVEVRTADGEAVPIDERLIAALPDSANRIVNQLQPSGALTLWARFERQDNPPVMKKELKLGLEDCAVKYELFPYPLHNIRGTVTMVNDHWTVKDLKGENDTAWVTCNGGWGPDKNRVLKLKLKFDANDVPLEDELRKALRPDAQNVWKSLHPRGTIDILSALVEFDGATRKTSVDLTATKGVAAENVPGRTITVKPTWLPYQLDEVEGTLTFRDGITNLENVSGRHDATFMSIQKGEVRTTPDGHWQISLDPLNVDRIEVTHELTTALPTRLGEAITRLHINGPLSVSGAMSMKGMKGNASPTSTDWNLLFDIENGGLKCGVLLDHIHGSLKLAGSVDQKGLFSQGWIEVDSLIYNGIQFTKVQGPISLDDKRLGLGEWATRDEKTSFARPINARVFSGSLASSGEVMLGGDMPFKLESRLADGDLTAISRETTSRRHELSGRTFADLQLAGTSKGTHTFQGSGNVKLRDADIYELPVMVRMLKLLRIKQPDETAFTSCDVQYHIAGDCIYFDSIHFDGDVISLDGEGDMTLARDINLTCFTSLGSDNVRDWLVRPFLKEAGKQLMQIKVTGSLDNPQVDGQLFNNVRENIQSIFPATPSTTQPAMTRLPKTVEPNPPR